MNKDVSMVVDEERNKAKVVCLGTTLRVGYLLEDRIVDTAIQCLL